MPRPGVALELLPLHMTQTTPPLSREPLRFVTPAIHSSTLANGTKVRLIPSDAEDVLSITIGVDTGAVHDVILGETTFTARMLARGTQRSSPQDFAEEVESRGCSINAGASYDVTTISAVGLAQHAEAMLTLMTECLMTPLFDADEIDRERQRRVADMMMHADDPEWLAVWATMHVTYHGHPYGRPRDGVPSTLAAIDADVMRTVHARMLRAPRAIIVAGRFDVDAMRQRIEQALSPLPIPDMDPRIEEGTSWTRTAVMAAKDDAVQSVLRIGLPNVPYDHPDMPALSVATSALGGYTLARLFTILREQKGYTYGAYAFPDMRRYGRSTVIGTSVGNDYTLDTVKTLHDELHRIATQPLEPDELEHARQYMLGAFARNNETPQQTAGLAWTILQYGLSEDYYTSYISRLQQVTIDDCMRAQRTYLDPSAWCLGVSGNESVLRTALDGMVDRVVMMDVNTRMLNDA